MKMKMKKGILILALLSCAFVSLAQRTRVINPGSGGANIYNTSDTLTSDREVGLNGHRLVIVTDSVPSEQTGLELRPGLYNELAGHWPLIIAAGPRGFSADSIAFGSYDSNLLIYTNTNGLRYAANNTFTNPRHIIDKQYCDANVAGSTGAGKGGIYEGDGYLPENIRASGGASERIMSFDSISYLEIKDWNEGQALRVFQDFSGVTKFGRGITYVGATDSLDISYTEAGANSIFTIDATKPINIDAPNTVINPDSISFNFGNATFTDNRAGLGGATHGIKYAADYSASYVSRSLVDKAYCDANGGDPANFIILIEDTGIQNIGNTWEAITTIAQSIEVGTMFSFNSTTDQVTYTGASGYIEVWFNLSWESSNTFDPLTWVVRKNGTNTRAISITEAAGSGELIHAGGHTIMSVANGDDFDFGTYFTTSSGSNVSFENIVVGYRWIGN